MYNIGSKDAENRDRMTTHAPRDEREDNVHYTNSKNLNGREW